MNYEEVLKLLEKEYPGKAVVKFDNPFKVLISTILSQRTKDVNTEKASKKLFSKFTTPKQILEARVEEVEDLIKSSGFYKVKTRRIKQVSKRLLEDFGGKVPNSMEGLESLPGVGHKTAACVMVYGFGEPEIPVDVHVARISQRLGWTREKKPEKIRQDLLKKIPKNLWLELNRLFVRHGQKKCFATKPRCSDCRMKNYCDYYERNVRADNKK